MTAMIAGPVRWHMRWKLPPTRRGRAIRFDLFVRRRLVPAVLLVAFVLTVAHALGWR